MKGRDSTSERSQGGEHINTPTASVTLDRMELATVRIDATAESLAARLWRKLWGGMLRESGF